ncbi:hypothetical protein OH687_06430 [Burkholderia anthina]|nr:hypothetical protein OH687_06430 [Burkholderia anthina]
MRGPLFAGGARPANAAESRRSPRRPAESVIRQGFQRSYNAAIERFG